MVSRLASQKGFDLVRSVLDPLFQRNVQFVILGTGDKQYEDCFREAALRYRGKTGVRIAYEESLAHKIVAGADMFLVPSRYEPSGLTQLYSLKYGTIPIVRATGGLKDSVEDFDPATGKGTGFRFEAYETAALLGAIGRAVAAFGGFAPSYWWRILPSSARRGMRLCRTISNRNYETQHLQVQHSACPVDAQTGLMHRPLLGERFTPRRSVSARAALGAFADRSFCRQQCRRMAASFLPRSDF